MEKRASLALVDQDTRVIPGHVIGQLVGETAEGPLVDYPQNPHGPIAARSTVRLQQRRGRPLAKAEVLLVFENERSDRPIIVGLLRKLPEATPAAPSPAQAKLEGVQATVDGKRLILEAEDEIVLRCGKASVTLRRNGRVVIRGTYVETRAEGVNRIKGGSVQIN